MRGEDDEAAVTATGLLGRQWDDGASCRRGSCRSGGRRRAGAATAPGRPGQTPRSSEKSKSSLLFFYFFLFYFFFFCWLLLKYLELYLP